MYAKNVVATSQPLAAQAGLSMLQRGGNAVDAALAAAITLTVVEPTGCGIGSDAFALVWDGTKLHGLNGSGKSPQAWSASRFDHCRMMPEIGWDSVTVPGAVDAWQTLSQRFGVLPFADLFKPAIGYARFGYHVSPIVAAKWAEAPNRFKDFPEFAEVFLPNGRPPRAGELFAYPPMAETLTEIAATNAASFYQGKLAQKIHEHARSTGGALTQNDLAQHASQWVDPIDVDYRGYQVFEMPPNGQGIVALIALGILRHHDITRFAIDSADFIHLQVEAMKIAFSEVHCHIADPECMQLDCQQLLTDAYLSARAQQIRMDRAQTPQSVMSSDPGTVYLSAADQAGWMVSFIQSNYWGFGSGIVVPETGISLHSRGSGFCLVKDHPNQVDGCKRPFHTIIPGFVMHRNKPWMSFGVMGAHMQPQGHVQMITRVCDYGVNPQAAIDAPRWCVDENFNLALESGIRPSVIAELQQRGHRLVRRPDVGLFGGAQLIVKTKDGYVAASDHRKDGQAVGF